MKTTAFRPVFMGPVDLRDREAIRAAIHELEASLNALDEVPFTEETLKRLAFAWGYYKEQGRVAYHYLSHAIERHWRQMHPELTTLGDDTVHTAFRADRKARGLAEDGYYLSELRMDAVRTVLDDHPRAHRVRELLLRFLTENSIT